MLIACRELYLVDGPNKKFRLEIFAPVQLANGGIWECVVQVTGATDEYKMTAGGGDSYQALIIGLGILKILVSDVNKVYSGRLRFMSDGTTDLKLDLP